MLWVKCKEHAREVKKFAESTGQLGQLEGRLAYLNRYGCHPDEYGDVDLGETRCILMTDIVSPLSFYFNMQRRDEDTGDYTHWFNGGLVYHEGSGWSINT